MIHKPYIPAVAVLTALLSLAACTGKSENVQAASLKPEGQRKPAPDFRLRDADGKILRLSDYRGKVVVLNFWATWCPPCRVEIPWLMEFERQYKDQGFAVIGVSMDEDGWDVVKPYIERAGVNYRIVLGDDVVSQLYGGVDSLPSTFLIDREGRVANVHIGLTSRAELREDVEKLLAAGSSRVSASGN